MRGYREEIKKKKFQGNAPTPCAGQIGQGLARKGNSLGQGQSGEDILKLETEINSSSLSVWQRHLVGAWKDRGLGVRSSSSQKRQKVHRPS